VSGAHPDEIQLLDYVEGDLDHAARDVVEAHTAECAECAQQIRLLEAGREALRGAPMLAAPRFRPGLPERPARRPSFRLGRLVAVLSPVAVVAGAVAIFVLTEPNEGGEDEQGARAVAAETAADSAEGGAEEAAPNQAFSTATVRSVAGPARDVVRTLQAKGFEARRVDDRVEVSGTTAQQVEVALADRPNGPVEVVAVP
jgi:anti-sigma factor RsiW